MSLNDAFHLRASKRGRLLIGDAALPGRYTPRVAQFERAQRRQSLPFKFACPSAVLRRIAQLGGIRAGLTMGGCDRFGPAVSRTHDRVAAARPSRYASAWFGPFCCMGAGPAQPA